MTIIFIVSVVICCLSVITLIISSKRLFELQKRKEVLEKELKEWEAREAEARHECFEHVLKTEKAKSELAAVNESMATFRKQAEENTEQYYLKLKENADLRFEQAAEELAQQYRQAAADYEIEYQKCMEEYAQSVHEYGDKARKLLDILDDLKSKEAAAVAARKRSLEASEKINFYRIQIPESDLLEIAKLREIIPQLRDQDTLNKVIYKIYYENPTNDLIGRVVGSKQGGIYKITNIHNGKCYVGQAVNFANRWKQHIKRGVGAEPMTHNKLYPAMLGDGIENFTFEVIEECPPNKLNERETYWQDYFKAKEFGYSIR